MYWLPFGNMYDGNIPIASAKTPTEQRSTPQAQGLWQVRPASLIAVRAATSADAGYAQSSSVSYSEGGLSDIVDLENYAVTSCLNHNLHAEHGLDSGSVPRPGIDPQKLLPNYLEAQRWMHVQISWQALPPW